MFIEALQDPMTRVPRVHLQEQYEVTQESLLQVQGASTVILSMSAPQLHLLLIYSHNPMTYCKGTVK